MKESRRSVTPNGELIDSLRKQRGWTIEELAQECDIGMRTAQKALAGTPVSIDVLRNIADGLDSDGLKVTYEALLKKEVPSTVVKHELTDGLLKIQIELSVAGGATPKNLPDIISFLQKFLPDNGGICILAAVTGSAIIGVSRTAANEAALADPAFKKGLADCGAEGFGLQDGAEHLVKKQTDRDQYIPDEIPWLGDPGPHAYMRSGEVHYRISQPETPWSELTKLERLKFCIEHKKAYLSEFRRHRPFDWGIITDGKPLNGSKPEELYAYAIAELGLLNKDDPDQEQRLDQLNELVLYCKNQHGLNPLEDILRKQSTTH